MTIHLYVQRPRGVPASLVSASMVLRAALMVAALTMAIVPVFAAQLRGDVLAANDVDDGGPRRRRLRSGGCPPPLPVSGAWGQRHHPGEAGARCGGFLGLKNIETAGRAQITVTGPRGGSARRRSRLR